MRTRQVTHTAAEIARLEAYQAGYNAGYRAARRETAQILQDIYIACLCSAHTAIPGIVLRMARRVGLTTFRKDVISALLKGKANE